MPILNLNQQNLPFHRDQILALEETTLARWGGMDAAAMVCHLRAVVEMSLGEIEVEQVIPPIVGKPIGLLFSYVITRWPKGKKGTKPPAPALCPAPTLPFTDERHRLLAALERFVDRHESDPRHEVPHPMMGPTSLARWSRVHGVHFRHHFRQFGIE